MASFLKNWLKNNDAENSEILNELSNSEKTKVIKDNKEQISEGRGDNEREKSFNNPEEIVYESNDYKIIVKREQHKRQKRFKLEDNLFHIKIVPLSEDNESPLLSEILDFLNRGLSYILQKLKLFFKANEHRIAYLTLYQQPMEILIQLYHTSH